MVCLVVENSQVERDTTKEIIESFGMDVFVVENSEQALEFCQNTMPDYIFLDINMPGTSGPEFLEILRDMADGDRPYIIVTTGMDLSDAKDLCKDSADEFLIKPFGMKDVKEKLSKVNY